MKLTTYRVSPSHGPHTGDKPPGYSLEIMIQSCEGRGGFLAGRKHADERLVFQAFQAGCVCKIQGIICNEINYLQCGIWIQGPTQGPTCFWDHIHGIICNEINYLQCGIFGSKGQRKGQRVFGIT